MIKFKGEGPQGPLYGLGLSRGNIDRLIEGQPILVNLADIGGPPIQITILFGETEQALFDELKQIGAIHPDVKFIPAEPGETRVTRVRREGGDGR